MKYNNINTSLKKCFVTFESYRSELNELRDVNPLGCYLYNNPARKRKAELNKLISKNQSKIDTLKMKKRREAKRNRLYNQFEI